MKWNNYFLIGVLLQAVLVYLGLGLVGYGYDHLTNFIGNFVIAKVVFGLAVMVCTLMITHGYYIMRDGVLVPQLIKNGDI